MDYTFTDMNEDYAKEIAFEWKYNGVYSFYDMTADQEDLELFLDEENWDHYFAVLNEAGDLIGYYSYYYEDEIMWIGFGLKPALTGKGYGSQFVLDGIDYLVERFEYHKPYIMLAVATFNKRAIKAYEKIGFQGQEQFIQETNGGKYEFIKMRKCL